MSLGEIEQQVIRACAEDPDAIVDRRQTVGVYILSADRSDPAIHDPFVNIPYCLAECIFRKRTDRIRRFFFAFHEHRLQSESILVTPWNLRICTGYHAAHDRFSEAEMIDAFRKPILQQQFKRCAVPSGNHGDRKMQFAAKPFRDLNEHSEVRLIGKNGSVTRQVCTCSVKFQIRAAFYQFAGVQDSVPITIKDSFTKIAEVDHQNNTMNDTEPLRCVLQCKNGTFFAFQTDVRNTYNLLRTVGRGDAKRELWQAGLCRMKVLKPRIGKHIAAALIDAFNYNRMRAYDFGNKCDRDAAFMRSFDQRLHVMKQFFFMDNQFRIVSHRILSFNNFNAASGSSLERTPIEAMI